jgi:hypothetical protein
MATAMSIPDDLLEAAMNLPADDREELAAMLLESLADELAPEELGLAPEPTPEDDEAAGRETQPIIVRRAATNTG